MKRQMAGDNRERRVHAKEARDAGSSASEVGASTSADKQRTRADNNMTHQERLDLKREGKRHTMGGKSQAARPGSRDSDSVDQERFPRR